MSNQPTAFFLAMADGFGGLLRRNAPGMAMIEALVGQAFDWFERNIEIQAANQPCLACAKGCPTCCALRVTATAPEIFLLADYVRRVEAQPGGEALGLSQRIRAAHEATQGLSEGERLAQAWPCPLMVQDQCIMHPVRTLACRGHAAFDVEHCRAAARGDDVDVAISEPHLMLRGLVQNALQSALRAGVWPGGSMISIRGLPWRWPTRSGAMPGWRARTVLPRSFPISTWRRSVPRSMSCTG